MVKLIRAQAPAAQLLSKPLMVKNIFSMMKERCYMAGSALTARERLAIRLGRKAIITAGNENDGAQAAGWASLDIVDSDYTEDEAWKSSSNVFDDENQTRWFYFKSNGKKMIEEKGKTINGKKYSFDEYGRMNAEWVIYDATPTTAKTATGSITATQGSADYTTNWRYYGYTRRWRKSN